MTNKNGENSWAVPFSDITWFERLLTTHKNVENVDRHDDIIFEVERVKQGDHLRIFCCRQYAMSLTLVQKAIADFGPINIIYIGGGWNSYTGDAKGFCLEQQVGLYNAREISGGLWSNECWAYELPD